MRDKRTERDGTDHHMTILKTSELKNLTAEQNEWLRNNLVGINVWLECISLGKQARDHNSVYFVIVTSRLAQEARAHLNLGHKDLHVTLGFDVDDIHNVGKDEDWQVSPGWERLRRWGSFGVGGAQMGTTVS